LDNSYDEEKKRKDSTHDTSHKEIKNESLKHQFEPEPCSCLYQHAREIAEKKKEISENPPCSCLLNSMPKGDTCPCLNKRNI